MTTAEVNYTIQIKARFPGGGVVDPERALHFIAAAIVNKQTDGPILTSASVDPSHPDVAIESIGTLEHSPVSMTGWVSVVESHGPLTGKTPSHENPNDPAKRIHALCVAITASDPKLSLATREMVNRIGDICAGRL